MNPNPIEIDTPSGLTVLIVIGVALLVLVVFLFVAWKMRRIFDQPRRQVDVPPIPMAAEFDPNLPPEQRMAELHWLEALMESPAKGEEAEDPQQGQG